ncbi:ABC transporter permease subunit [Reinekea blandensis]|uniref:Thiamin ABC transporter membrane component n=1 Tax=Reinekea blandensis MED297 TaxID=314283 RepID=A4BCA4_9GAMM|nr:ABC transporter permease subunit [Reinekea blandensis]EAR10170.1 thiamin ABC transporter membrane component [Reinekea sp. MED297] [Reinekea blandensis MED297]
MIQRLAFLPTAVILLTLALAGVGLILHPGQGGALVSYFDAWFLQILKFSVLQATLSAVGSVLLAVPFALILATRPFRQQWLIQGLMNLFFIMPVLTVVLGVVAVFNDWFRVFSLTGIVVAHLYLNVPYAIRLFWERLSQYSQTHAQVAVTLNMTAWQRFRVLKLPILIDAFRPIFVLIFLMCFSSFTVVLTLSGGPANTNLEVAVFQSLKLDFDPKGAAFYAFFHGLIAFLILFFLGRRDQFGIEFNRLTERQHATATDTQWLAIAVLLFVLSLPLFGLTVDALSAPFAGSSRFGQALTTSLLLALGSGVLATVLALCRSLSKQQGRFTRFLDFGLLVLPMMVITTGLLLLTLKLHIAFKMTFFLIIWLNALMAMPLIITPLQSRIQLYHRRYQPLAESLGMPARTRLGLIYLPAVLPLLPWAMVLSMVLSIGDLGVAALLGSAQFVTLPILIYQAMGSYQLVLASQLTLILLVICAVLLLAAEWIGGRLRYA